jgi:hypothetical protein
MQLHAALTKRHGLLLQQSERANLLLASAVVRDLT